jgi:hypothetical protein
MELCEVAPGGEVEAGGFRLEVFDAWHSQPGMLTRLTDHDGRVVAYTGDSDLSDELVRGARGADLLISEATWLDGAGEFPRGIHMTGRQAGELARHGRRSGRCSSLMSGPSSTPRRSPPRRRRSITGPSTSRPTTWCSPSARPRKRGDLEDAVSPEDAKHPTRPATPAGPLAPVFERLLDADDEVAEPLAEIATAYGPLPRSSRPVGGRR